MAAHAKSRSKIAAITNWAAAALAAIMVFGIGCVAGYQAQDSFGQAPFWIIYGGNTDPGNGNGQGAARDQMVAGGWVSYENSYQVTWAADIGGGGENQVNEAMPQGHRAIADFCGGRQCIIAGFSWGTAPALQLAGEAGIPGQNTYLFGGPQHSSGVWQSPYVDNPFVQPWIAGTTPLNPDRLVRPGVQVYYDTRDPFSNAAPQCGGPGLFLLGNHGHYIVPANAAFHIWTGRFGEVIHEVGYQPAPWGLPRSGSDPSQPWDFCPPNMPAFPIPARNGDPGVPALPGIPTR